MKNKEIPTVSGGDTNKDQVSTSHDSATDAIKQADQADFTPEVAAEEADSFDVEYDSIRYEEDLPADQVGLYDAVDDDKAAFGQSSRMIAQLHPWLSSARPESEDFAQLMAAQKVVERYKEMGTSLNEELLPALRRETVAVTSWLVDRQNMRVGLARKKLKDGDVQRQDLEPGMRSWTLPKQLSVSVMAYLVSECVLCGRLVANPKARDGGILLRYHESGEHQGTYRKIEDVDATRWLTALAGARLNRIGPDDLLEELYQITSTIVENHDEDLVFWANGIWRVSTREMLQFSKDIIRTYKSPVRLLDSAPEMPTRTMPDGKVKTVLDIFNDWTPYDGGVKLLLQVAGAALRNTKVWRKAIWLYNDEGRNGKSVYLELLKALVGSENVLERPFRELCNDRFGRTGLVSTALVSCGDSNAGAFMKNTDVFKQITSHDEISVEEKNKNPFNYRPHVLIVACMNELMKIKGKENAVYDRLVIVPFVGRFEEGVADTGLSKWMCSQEVLEWLAYHIFVEMEPYDKIDIPQRCWDILGAHKEASDPVLEFWNNWEGKDSQIFYPSPYLFSEFSAWHRENYPDRMVNRMNQGAFSSRLEELLRHDETWIVPRKQLSSGHEEPRKFSVKGWYRGRCLVLPANVDPLRMSGDDRTRLSKELTHTQQSGVVRRDVLDYFDFGFAQTATPMRELIKYGVSSDNLPSYFDRVLYQPRVGTGIAPIEAIRKVRDKG